MFWNSDNYTGCKLGGGNGLIGYKNAVGTIGKLYLNWVSATQNVQIDEYGKITYCSTGTWSDLRLKNVLGLETDVLDRMLRIPVIRFVRTDIPGSTEETGFGAQTFLGLFANVAYVQPETGYYAINSGAILAIAFQGVKELYTRFLPVEREVDILKKRIDNLQQRLDNAYREIFILKGGEAA